MLSEFIQEARALVTKGARLTQLDGCLAGGAGSRFPGIAG